MLAVVLTFDPHMPFAELVVEQYADMWEGHPFTFRVPYNETLPERLKARDDVELVQTSSGIRETMDGLLQGIGDSEWVFWAIDDRYPVLIRDMKGLEEVTAFVMGNPEGIDEIKLTHHPGGCGGEVATFGQTLFHQQDKGKPWGFWMHHFVRAGLLKRHFSHSLPDEYVISAVTAKLKAEEITENILMPERSLVHFGEPCWRGKMTSNGAERLRAHDIPLPKIKGGGGWLVYGDHGEQLAQGG